MGSAARNVRRAGQGLGMGMIAQVFPFHCSLSGSRSPVPLSLSPTAMHRPAKTHEMLPRRHKLIRHTTNLGVLTRHDTSLYRRARQKVIVATSIMNVLLPPAPRGRLGREAW